MSVTTLAHIRRSLRDCASQKDAGILRRFFKTGPGEYGEGDLFLGVRAPDIRKVCRQADGLSLVDARKLLHSKFHEERLLALLILVRGFEHGEEQIRRRIFDFYLRETRFINNWDLVDLSAPDIVGHWLLTRPRRLLGKLARSGGLWERRIAMLATFTFIRAGQFDDTLWLCRELLGDKHDLIHKACGWMLREVGKRDVKVLEKFLRAHAGKMPRTMLRYAIERLPAKKRKAWLAA